MTEQKPQWNGNEGHALTDLQEYNINLKHNTERLDYNTNRLDYQSKIIKLGLVIFTLFGLAFLSILVYLIWQVNKWNLVTKTLEALS